MINEIIKDISKLDTLMIPAVSDGLPYVRLDQLADIFIKAGGDASPITDKIHWLMSRFRNDQVDVH